MTTPSTVLAPSENKPEQNPLRLLSITANLLPPEITDARRGKALKRLIAAVLVVVIIALVGWDYHVRQQTSAAQTALNSAQNESVTLRHQQSSYAGLLATKNSAQAITTELQTLMAQDLQWWKLLPMLRATAPTGVTLTNVSGAIVTSATGGVGAASTGQAGLSTATAIGTITIVGQSPDKLRIATFVQALGGVTGLADPDLQSAVVETGGAYQFNVQVEITDAALGGRYSVAKTATTGGH